MDIKKTGNVFKVVYGDGTAECFRALTSELDKARQIAEYTGLKCGGIVSIEMKYL